MSTVSRTTVFTFMVIGLVAFAAGALMTVAADGSSTTSIDQAEGVTVEQDPQTESELLEIAKEAAETTPGVKAPSNAALLYTDGDVYVLVSDQEIETGETIASGTIVPLSERNVMFADDIETTTQGNHISVDEFRSNPDKYDRELVRVKMDYQQASLNTEAGDGTIVSRMAFGTESAENGDIDVLPPGKAGVWTATSLTGDGGNSPQTNELKSRLDGSGPFITDTGDTRYWVDSKVTLDLVVLTETTDNVHIADIEVASQNVDNIKEIHSGDYDNQVITIRADTTEARISTKETLLASASCGEDMFYAGSTCVPAVTDAVVHVGVLYDKPTSSQNQMLLYAGISNKVQTAPVDTQHRNVKLTGRVVSTSAIDPQLGDARALVVYDADYINHNGGGPPGEAVEYRQKAQEETKHQIEEEGDESSDQKTTNEGGNSGIRIIDVDYPEQHDGTATVNVTLRNQGDTVGEKEVRVHLGATNTAPDGQKTVPLDAGQQTTVTFSFEISKTKGVALHVNNEQYGFINPPAQSIDSDQSSDNGQVDTSSSHTDGDRLFAAFGPAPLLPLGFGFVGLVLFLIVVTLDLRRYYRSYSDKPIDTSATTMAAITAAALLFSQLAVSTIQHEMALASGGLLGFIGASAIAAYGCLELPESRSPTAGLIAIGTGSVWVFLTVTLTEITSSIDGKLLLWFAAPLGAIFLISGLVVEILRQIKCYRADSVSTRPIKTLGIAGYGAVLLTIGILIHLTSGKIMLGMAFVPAVVAVPLWIVYRRI